jgi:hypothetical protein
MELNKTYELCILILIHYIEPCSTLSHIEDQIAPDTEQEVCIIMLACLSPTTVIFPLVAKGAMSSFADLMHLGYEATFPGT